MERTIAMLERAEDIRSCFGIQECASFGLMSGMAGIGYSCLCGVEESAKILKVAISDIS